MAIITAPVVRILRLLEAVRFFMSGSPLFGCRLLGTSFKSDPIGDSRVFLQEIFGFMEKACSQSRFT